MKFKLTVLCFGIYAISYMGRLNYSAALPEMMAMEILSKTNAGLCATIYFAAYGIGQMINGYLAEHSKPLYQIVVGISCSAAMNFLMPLVGSERAMIVIWGVNGYAQSLLWAPCFLLISQNICLEFREKALLILNTAPSFGTILGFGFSSCVLRGGKWQNLFSFSAYILAAGAIAFALGMISLGRKNFQKVNSVESAIQKKQKNTSHHEKISSAMIWTSGLLFLIFPAMINGMLKDGITSWMPTYMTEIFHLSSERSAQLAMILPVINMTGASMAYWLFQKLQNEISATIIIFGLTAAFLGVLLFTQALSPVVTAVIFAMVTAFMMGCSVILVSQVPIRFSKMGCAGTVSGFLNSCSYLGTAVSMYGIAWVTENYGWTATQIMYILSGITALVCLITAAPIWHRFIHKKT